MDHAAISSTVKAKLAAQFESLDPVRLLQEIRLAQQSLIDVAARAPSAASATNAPAPIEAFLASLSSAWKDGEVRPTHRKRAKATHWWRSRADPFAAAWPVVEGWLIAEPAVGANVLMDRLAAMIPEAYAGKAQLRTLQRRVKEWRSARARELILGRLRDTAGELIGT